MACIGTTRICCTSIGHAGKKAMANPVRCAAKDTPLGSRGIDNQALTTMNSRWRPNHNAS